MKTNPSQDKNKKTANSRPKTEQRKPKPAQTPAKVPLFENRVSTDSSNVRTASGTRTSTNASAKANAKAKAKEALKRKRAKRSPFKRVMSAVGRVMLTIFLIGVVSTTVLTTIIAVYIFNNIDTRAGLIVNGVEIDLRNLQYGYTAQIYAENTAGDPIEIKRLHGEENRIWVELEDMPQMLQDAFISTEDQRFMMHDGVDWKRTVSAFGNLIFNFWNSQQGGSTITQQLIKNITGEDEVRIERKVEEIVRAINLEKFYTKQEILEAYLNTIPLGKGTCGVEAASNMYFGKSVGDLTIAECASLAGITRNPAGNNPMSSIEKNRERMLYTLKNMRTQGYITQQEYDDAIAQELEIKTIEVVKDKTLTWFEENLVEEIIADLMREKGWNRKWASQMLYSGGYKIYTTIDLEAQEKAEKFYLDEKNFSNGKIADNPQAAFVLMNYSGEIKALVGGKGKKETNREFNRASQAMRQIGSSMKPISIYGLALEMNIINYASTLNDTRITTKINGKNTLWPKNVDNTYQGPISLVKAIIVSKNTTAVRLSQQMTPRRSFDFLQQKLGITTLVSSKKAANGDVLTDINMGSMALGALTDGLLMTEVVGAYQIFGNGGVYYKPHSYTKIVDLAGNIVLEHKKSDGKQVIGDDTSYIMNKLLQNVVEDSNGTGRYAKLKNFVVCAKTGTTNDDKDRYFVALTPYHVSAIWVGYDIPKPLPSNIYRPAEVWAKLMTQILANYEPAKSFEMPDSVVERAYCTSTGKLAGSGCSTAKGYFKKSHLPGKCSGHAAPAISETGEAASSTPEASTAPAA